ncbi:bacterio-opsin activator domain-containing protein [Haloferax namakaokahaiae]|uniref:Bacterio-opsin activator domain-containing protein n=1 Tax=Haloferax namakaokahaiae TaxID=1748331 RepID=A0ABD5ZIV8_9EURY
MTDERINVLLIDDDEQWAQYMASELEDKDPVFSVKVALNANEAVLALANDRSIECVVTDFRMPEIDGIQVLEHLQGLHANLPIILTTGDGNEEIAAQAINAGVTDYIRKDPRIDQAPIFVNRIRQAVERAKLRTEVQESEHRYRTVVEHTRDAIVVLQNDELAFANDQFHELCDCNIDLAFSNQISSFVHEGDHKLLNNFLAEIRSGDDPGLREICFVRPTGEFRHCEILGDGITFENEPAILLSIRDVTIRRSRERTLKREREFNQAVLKQLVNVQTRDELELGITDVLSSYGYDFVWIGAVDERGVHTHTAVGGNEYVRRLEDNDIGSDHGGDPILWSARTSDSQFVPDFEELMPTKSRNSILESGFRAGFALPLQHEDISYGTIAVYHDELNQIDEAERLLLSEIAETVSFAIHHVETRLTLTSAAGIVVKVQLESDAYYLPDLLSERADHPNVEVTVRGTHIVDGDTQVQYLSCSTDRPEAFTDALDGHPSVRTWKVIDSGEPVSYQVTVKDETPEAHLGSVGALVRSTTVTPDHATITFELSSREYLQPVIDRLNDHYASVTVPSVVEKVRDQTRNRSVQVDIDVLTTKQLVALEAAYHQGYFDRPRRNSAIDIAKSLGITHTTYLQHLRVAQEKMFRQIFAGLDESANSRNR